MPTHPAEPLLPTADLYTHLSVARHLAAGDGFRTDVAYPLSFAFPFARHLPQPLIHRGPGYSLLMVLPCKAAGGDPAGTIRNVRRLQILILGLIVFTGAAGFLRRGELFDIGPWLVFLATNPLLVFAVDWGFEELAAGWVLLLLWLRIRSGTGPGIPDGILAGVLSLLRLDLFWLPLLWWVWFGRERRKQAAPRPWSGVLLAMALAAVIQLPWAVRNVQLTGRPFFSLQGQAELVKDTSVWPGYSVYKQLTPQPVSTALAASPVPILRKTARGLRFFATNLPRLLPWPLLVLGVLLVFALMRGKITRSPCPFRPDREEPMSILPEDTLLGPLAAAFFTAVLLMIQYSLFDHSLRHLLVLVPVLAWEFSPLTGTLAAGFAVRRLTRRPSRTIVMAGTILLTLALVRVSWSPPAGWYHARAQARAATPDLEKRVAAFLQDTCAVPFVQASDLPWYGNRPAVWDPGDEETRAAIRAYLAR